MIPRFHVAHGLPLVLEPGTGIDADEAGGDGIHAEAYAIRLGPVLIGLLSDDDEGVTHVCIPEPTCPADEDIITGIDQSARIQLALEGLVEKLLARSQLRARQLGLIPHPVVESSTPPATIWLARGDL